MGLNQVISLIVAVTLVEMSFATGLGVRLADVAGAARDVQQLLGVGLANYVAVPAAAVTLILLVDGDPLVKKLKVELPKVPKAEPRPKGTKDGFRAGHIVEARD